MRTAPSYVLDAASVSGSDRDDIFSGDENSESLGSFIVHDSDESQSAPVDGVSTDDVTQYFRRIGMDNQSRGGDVGVVSSPVSQSRKRRLDGETSNSSRRRIQSSDDSRQSGEDVVSSSHPSITGGEDGDTSPVIEEPDLEQVSQMYLFMHLWVQQDMTKG